MSVVCLPPVKPHSHTQEHLTFLPHQAVIRRIAIVMMTLFCVSFLQAQQNHGEKPHNYGIKVQNNPHLKILQQEIAQIDYQIALTQYNQAYYNRTQGRQQYQNRLRTLQQRKSHLGWLIYKMIVKDPVR